MLFHKKNLARVFAVTAAAFLCQCSKDGISADFKVSLVPSRPLVHEVGRIINDHTEVKPNWFSVSFNINNQTGRSIKIEEVTFSVQQEGDKPPLHSFDLGALSLTCGSETYNYIDYCTYPDGYSGPWAACLRTATDASQLLDPSPTVNLAYPCPAAGDTPGFDIHFVKGIGNAYIDGIKNANESDGKSTVYTVVMEMQGLIMDGLVESDRFRKRVVFTTR